MTTSNRISKLKNALIEGAPKNYADALSILANAGLVPKNWGYGPEFTKDGNHINGFWFYDGSDCKHRFDLTMFPIC